MGGEIGDDEMTTKLDRLVELGELVRSRNVDQGVAAELARLQFDCTPHLLAIARSYRSYVDGSLDDTSVQAGLDGLHALLEPVE